MGSLRVIGGKARGRRLRPVPGDTTRPITDRTKESLFNILGGDIVGATFLDLFAGTGSVGIEALSRGAGYVKFVDKTPAAIKTIRSNLEITGLVESPGQKQYDLLLGDAFAVLEKQAEIRFDYIYIAPPQYKEMWKKVVISLDHHLKWLSEDAWLIAQIHPIEEENLVLQNLEAFDRRRYGSTLLVFYRLKQDYISKT